MGSYTSRILYHMVGWGHPNDHNSNYRILRQVLQSMEVRTNEVGGVRGGITIRTDPSRSMTKGEPIEQTVTCYCDIPLGLLHLHAGKYGEFGVGVDRAVVAARGGRPVSYVPKVPRSPLSLINLFPEVVMQAGKDLQTHFADNEGPVKRSRVVGAPSESPHDAAAMAATVIHRDVLAFMKVFDVDLPDEHPENFYMEREWRKFGNLDLVDSIRRIVAPARYHERIRSEFPSLDSLDFVALPD